MAREGGTAEEEEKGRGRRRAARGRKTGGTTGAGELLKSNSFESSGETERVPAATAGRRGDGRGKRAVARKGGEEGRCDVKGGRTGRVGEKKKRNPSRYWLAIDANFGDVAFRPEAEPHSTYCSSPSFAPYGTHPPSPSPLRKPVTAV